ncbi:MAG: gamma carbonic anhydrase family protein, partial [Lachnospiraceae bacterium]|nr:gamma carbonic anhydrase family protein [Lachnospiraceae bacterium]
GMGAILLNGAVVGKNCIIGAGALITRNTVIPDNSLVIGSPARVKRAVTDGEIAANRENALHYVQEGKEYAAYLKGEKL